MSFCTSPPASLESILYDRSTDHFRQFTAFVHSTFCTENLAFWVAVQHYHDLCHRLIGYSSASSSSSSFLEEDGCCCYSVHHDDDDNNNNILLLLPPSSSTNTTPFRFRTADRSPSAAPPAFFGEIQEACHTILRNHIRPNSPQEINIPCEMREIILDRVEKEGNYHPAIFMPATDSVLELMRTNSFIPWCSSMISSAPSSPVSPSPPSPTASSQRAVTTTTTTTTTTSHQESILRRWWIKSQRRFGNSGSSSSNSLYLVSARPYLSAPPTPRSSGESIRNWSPWRKIQLHR